jgi:hypothetical protein
MRWLALGVVVALVSLGCGGTTAVISGSPDGSTAADGAAETGNDASMSGDVTLSMLCPAAPPAAGTGCPVTQTPLACEYGASFYPECDRLLDCDTSAQSWKLRFDGMTCPFGAPSPTCPTSFGVISPGGSCTLDQSNCDYPEAHCECITGCGGPPPPPDSGTPSAHWVCDAPGAGCPTSRPRFGVPCNVTTPAGGCVYQICCERAAMSCQGGFWGGDIQVGGCP